MPSLMPDGGLPLQADTLADRHMVVAMDSWKADSGYPLRGSAACSPRSRAGVLCWYPDASGLMPAASLAGGHAGGQAHRGGHRQLGGGLGLPLRALRAHAGDHRRPGTQRRRCCCWRMTSTPAPSRPRCTPASRPCPGASCRRTSATPTGGALAGLMMTVGCCPPSPVRMLPWCALSQRRCCWRLTSIPATRALCTML